MTVVRALLAAVFALAAGVMIDNARATDNCSAGCGGSHVVATAAVN